MAITVPADGHYVLANASVPEAVMGDARSGAVASVDLTISGGSITAIGPAGTAACL